MIHRADTPSHSLSSFDQRVTQWMPERTVTRGNRRNSSHVQVIAFDEPEAPERPARGVEARGESVGEDGPLGGQRLARGDAVRDGRIDAAHAMPPELPENSGHWPAPTIIWTP